MHRTTVFIPDDLHYRLRSTRSSISLLLELAALEALGPLLSEPPSEEAMRVWCERLRRARRARDKRFQYGNYGRAQFTYGAG